MKNLWVEEYRPKILSDYVFMNQNQKAQIEDWLKTGEIPHLLFSGSAGIGKTTLAKLLIRLLDVDQYDVLEINASRETGVDHLRDTVIGFASTMPFGKFKIILLDEADYLSQNAQATLRGVMETYAASARFILTCNYPNKIIPALHSRCQGFHFEKLDQVEFTSRAAIILVTENIQFDLGVLDSYVKATYPDLRKCINMLQLNSGSGTLLAPSTAAVGTDDYKFKAVELIKNGNIRDARNLICSQIRPEEFDEFFRWCYNNLDLWSKTSDGQDEAILIIRRGLVNHSMVADPEINVSAMLIELSRLEK